MGTVNRYLGLDGISRERLVVVPGQFLGDGTTTKGTERLYSDLSFLVYRAPFTATDFIAPSIWQVKAETAFSDMTFRVKVKDDSGDVQRVVVLYRTPGSFAWTKVELDYNEVTGWASYKVKGLATNGVATNIEYFAQAVDPTGNVALALDHGNPFTRVVDVTRWIYLPAILRK